MANVEIYIESPELEELVVWVEEKLSAATLISEDDDLLVIEGKYKGSEVPVVIQRSVEDGPFVGVWFDAEKTPWETDAECAHEAHKRFNLTVQCDPGDAYPQPDQFLQIKEGVESIVTIDLPPED